MREIVGNAHPLELSFMNKELTIRVNERLKNEQPKGILRKLTK